jgi:hypothetical protein
VSGREGLEEVLKGWQEETNGLLGGMYDEEDEEELRVSIFI